MSYIGYTENPDVPLFYFDGQKMPEPDDPAFSWGNPARGYLMKTEQLVDSTRNALGAVVAHKINRRLLKFDSLKWPLLSRNQVIWLKRKVANFEVKLTYYDDELDAVITRLFYFGNMSAEPFRWETVNIGGGRRIKRPTAYKDVSVNIIDMGK